MDTKTKTFSDLINKLNLEQTEKLIKSISEALRSKDNTIISLREEIANMTDHLYKDVKIKQLNTRIKKLEQENRNSFTVSKKEWKKINEWKAQHIKDKHNGNSYAGAIGGRFTYEFIPTSIGCIGTIKCDCGDSYTFQELD